MNVNPATIRSIDVTYTKKPVKKVTTYSPKGKGKQKSVKVAKLYTDAIVTMVSADGLDHTPCVLYTFNPKMNPVQKNTPRGRAVRQVMLDALIKYGIDEGRVVYTRSAENLQLLDEKTAKNPNRYFQNYLLRV